MVWRSLSDIVFSDAKQLLVGCREQLEKKYRVQLKSIAPIQNRKIKSKFSPQKTNCKMSYLILCFSEIAKIFVPVRHVAFLSENWKMFSVWSIVLFTVFALEMRERKSYRKQTGSNLCVLLSKVSALEHDCK